MTAVMKQHKLGDLYNRYLLHHYSGGWLSTVKMKVSLTLAVGQEKESVLGLSLPSGGLLVIFGVPSWGSHPITPFL